MDLYLELTKDEPSPEIFRKWVGIHAVGASVERRVWTQMGNKRLYPNLFLFLVGPPGVGKTVALSPMEYILRRANSVTLAPNDCTKQSLLDVMGQAAKGCIIDERPYDYHFLALHVRELSNFMSQYDSALAGLLTDLFDCPPVNEESKRGHDKGKALVNPGLSFIMGTATQQLGKTISEELWGSGFMARVIMVYSADEIIPDNMFAVLPKNEEIENEIVLGLARLGDLRGPMLWTPEAQRSIHSFRLTAKGEAPIHNKLAHYATRRWMHLAKLCMISALNDERMLVEADDIEVAKSWLLPAEGEMNEIFKDLNTHQDGAVHEELRQEMFSLHMRSGGKAIHASALYKWLSSRVASHSIEQIIAVAIAAGYFDRVAGTSGDDALYIPKMPPNLRPPGVL